MKKILISIFSFIYIFLLGFPLSVSEVKASEISSPISIEQSVDDDLKAFNFDYEKYKVNPDLVYRPIIVNFNESLSEEYMDLLYVYDPTNAFDLQSITYFVYYGEEENILNYAGTITKNMYISGTSSDGTIKRYGIYGYNSSRINNKYRRYKIVKLNDYSVDNVYLFEGNNGLQYSNCMNIRLENPHNWSWHFDEDTSLWEDFKDLFLKSDTLKDQLFYSFYIPDKWNVTNIESIDIKYKKALLEACRYNVADVGNTHDYYMDVDDDIYKPCFYKWNESNTKDNYDKSELLGHSVYDIGNKIEYTYETIKSSKVNSNGLIHSYEWDTIQNIDSFKTNFGEESDIYKFASQYISEDKNYWIINFDEFWYSYRVMYAMEDFGSSVEKLINYMIEHEVERNYYDFSYGYKGYFFEEEYVFDISATSITYKDGLNISRTLPTSVAPVMEKEGSGGTSNTVGQYIEFVTDSFKNNLSEKINSIISGILLIIGIVIILILVIPVLKSGFKTFGAQKKSQNKKYHKRYKKRK